MTTIDLTPMFPDSLVFTGTDQTLRRSERATYGKHRVWYVVPRYGTGNSDRWTLIGVPIPGGGNPAAAIENGQFARLSDAYEALDEAELLDDGAHEKD